MKKMLHNQHGDTIIEVVIAIAVLSLVLTAAFITSSNSLKATRDAQEHGEAQALVAGQLEKVKELAISAPANVFIGSTFCVGNSLNVISNLANCVFQSDGSAIPNAAYQPAYHTTINYRNNVFTAKAVWDSATGHGQATVTMSYRLYQ